MKKNLYKLCVLFFLIPVAGSAQYVGGQNQALKEKRDAQKEADKQADRNRQANTPANRNTSLSAADLKDFETWWNNRNVKTEPKVIVGASDTYAENAIYYSDIEQKRIEDIVIKYKNDLDVLVSKIVSFNIPCTSGNCKNGLGFSENSTFKLSANYIDGVKSGIATYYPKTGEINNINVTYENDFLSGIATIVYKDKIQFALNFTKNLVTNVATIYLPNQEKLNMHFNKGVISGRVTHIANKNYFSQYVYRNNKVFSTVRSISIRGTYFPTSGMYSNGTRYFTHNIGYKIYDKKGDGSFYFGELKDDVRSGMGSYVWENSSSYHGNWKKGEMTGQGTFYYADGGIYKGNFKDGKFSGIGVLEQANGNTYTGNFEEGKQAGKGKFVYANGDIYEGEFRNNKITGTGTMLFIDGSKYEGDWLNGQYHEKGTLTRKDGFYIKGAFLNGNESIVKYYNPNHQEVTKLVYYDLPESGFAKRKLENGDVYEGNWLNGKYHGEGKISYTNGNKFEGQFFEGNRKYGLFIWLSGSSYFGEFVNNQATGKTRFTWANGDYYIGEYLNWKLTGFGTLYFKTSQSIYEGNWLDSKLNGKGKITKKNGYYKEGLFNNAVEVSVKYYDPNGKEVTRSVYDK